MEQQELYDEAVKAVRVLDQDTFEVFAGWVVTDERDRRREEAAQAKAEMEVISNLVDEGKLEGAEASTEEQAREAPNRIAKWVDPGTDHSKMYRPEAVVEHNDRVWLNEVKDRLNSWEPGAPGVYDFIWRDITDEVASQPEPEAVPDEEGATVDVPAEPEPEDAPQEAEPDGSLEHPYPFKAGRSVKRGDYIVYNGKVFRMAQDHTMVDHYRPGPGLESIYQPV